MIIKNVIWQQQKSILKQWILQYEVLYLGNLKYFGKYHYDHVAYFEEKDSKSSALPFRNYGYCADSYFTSMLWSYV